MDFQPVVTDYSTFEILLPLSLKCISCENVLLGNKCFTLQMHSCCTMLAVDADITVRH